MPYFILINFIYQGIPGCYTNVAHYNSWIVDTIAKAENKDWLNVMINGIPLIMHTVNTTIDMTNDLLKSLRTSMLLTDMIL